MAPKHVLRRPSAAVARRPAGVVKKPSAALTRTKNSKVVLTQAALEEQVFTEFLEWVPTTPIEQAKEVASEIVGEWGNSPFIPCEIESIDGVNFAIVHGALFRTSRLASSKSGPSEHSPGASDG